MRHVLIVVGAGERDAANAEIRRLGIDPGPADNVSVELFPAAQWPQVTPSHYWCSWGLSITQVGLLPLVPGILWWEYDLDADVGFPGEKLTQMGLAQRTMVMG